MKTKEECLAFLEEVSKKVAAHKWDIQVSEPEDLLCYDDMIAALNDFDIPLPQKMDDGDCLLLPEGWLPDEDPENSKAYAEVAKQFSEIYKLLRYECSRQDEALMLEAEQDERDMHREYYRLVGWPFKN